jgi:hypothetical protein
MKHRVVPPIVGGVAVMLATAHASAHDLWLVPPEKPEPKKASFFRANSGTKFPKSDHAPDPAKFKRRLPILPDGSEGAFEASGIEDKSGLLKFEPGSSGVYVVAVETEPKLITLEADEFNNYLVSDGLPHIYQLRRKEGILDRPGRERYSKSPKAVVQVGSGGDGDPCRVLGLPLEIIPLRNPFALKVGDTLRVRVLFRGKPLMNANLGWDAPGDGDLTLGTVRADARGEALVPIIQHLGDIGMIHHRQGLPLGFKASDDLPGVHTGLNDFQCHPAFDWLLLLRHEHQPHAVFADLLQQLIRADDGAGFIQCLLVKAGQGFYSWLVHETAQLFVFIQQRFDLSTQISVGATGVFQESHPEGALRLIQGSDEDVSFRHCAGPFKTESSNYSR